MRASRIFVAVIVGAVTSFLVAPAALAVDGSPHFGATQNSTGEMTITGCTGCGAEVAIPGVVTVYSPFGDLLLDVNTVGSSSFQSAGITSLTLADSITAIEGNAFADNLLTSLDFTANTLDTIGDNAFSGNPITSVKFGSAVQSIGNQAISNPTPAEHFSFAGWLNSATGVVTTEFPNSTSTATTISAQWLGDPQTISFDATGGSPAPGDQTVAYGSTIPEPAAPFWSGHTFAGWFTSAPGGTEWDFDADTVAGDVTLFAQWAVNVRTVAGPASSHPGETLTITGTGFDPAEVITVELHSTPVTLATVTADATGAFSATVTIPADTAVGSHSIVANGVSGTATAAFAVTAAPVEAAEPTHVDTDAAPELAETGTGTAGLTGIAAALMMAGGLALVAARRRAS